jgi:CheY-like chemotaxis protein
MAKKILFIENDSAFAAGIAVSLEATGFDVRITADGKDGVDLAREWGPDAVVLCVELPGMSGYLVCQKLKKDDALRSLPLVLTSAEATEETFEKHRTLKARADDYLLKPYAPQELIDRLAALVGLPEPAEVAFADAGEEELVSLEEDLAFEPEVTATDDDVPGLSLDTLDDEPIAAVASPPPQEDEDLRLLDDAFDGLSATTDADAAAALDELTGEHPVGVEDLDAAAASLPEEDEGAARDALGALGLDEETDAALGALGTDDETLDALATADEALGALSASDEALGEDTDPGLALEGALDLEPPPARAAPAPVRGASADLLRAAGIMILDEETAPPSHPAAGAGAEDPARLARLERELTDVRDGLEVTRSKLADRDRQVAERESELGESERRIRELERRVEDEQAELERIRSRADDAEVRAETASAQARKAEAEVRAGREDARLAAEQARAAEAEVAALRAQLSEVERRAELAEEDARRRAEDLAAAAEAAARAEAAEREADELRTEILVARGEAEGARGEVERRTAELKKRIAELEAANAKNEERVVKAYQKIKSDEKVREKVRKALGIAAQLLDDGALPADSAAEKERRAAAALSGRE